MKEILWHKQEDMVCGSACVYYICKIEKIPCGYFGLPNMYWIMELGNFLKNKCNFNVCLYCSNSKLMRDYHSNAMPEGLYVKDEISSFLEWGGIIIEKEVSVEDIIKYCLEKRWVILNLRSDLLFEDDSLTGSNHFVILEACNKDEAVIISPGKRNIYKMTIPTNSIYKAMQDNGQWILCADVI